MKTKQFDGAKGSNLIRIIPDTGRFRLFFYYYF